MKKTFKRELAVALLIWFVYIVEVKDVSIIETLVWPVFTFVTAAFGLDQYNKLQQRSSRSADGDNRWGDSRSSEYAVGEDEHTDNRNNK